MNDNEIRLAIAPLCGWVCKDQDTGWYWLDEGTPQVKTAHAFSLPNYPEDLNACAEMEATLTPHELEWFEEHLKRIVHKATTDADWAERIGPTPATKYWHAKARQRCEAFLRVKGAWRDHP